MPNPVRVTFKGQPVTLVGRQLAPGDALPDFALTDTGLATVRAADTSGPRVFLAVPSLDTAVCDLEVRTFNAKAAQLPGVAVYAVSMDLPFAQARWCGAAGIDAVTTLSDHKERSFAAATGTLIAELALLARAVFVVDPAGRIVHAEYVPEVSQAPDYGAALAALDSIA
jgi:thiol peroxidase